MIAWVTVPGDEVLIRTGQRLQRVMRASDLVARIGGDGFDVCLSDVSDPSVVYRVAERIHDELGRSVEIDGESVRVGDSWNCRWSVELRGR